MSGAGYWVDRAWIWRNTARLGQPVPFLAHLRPATARQPTKPGFNLQGYSALLGDGFGCYSLDGHYSSIQVQRRVPVPSRIVGTKSSPSGENPSPAGIFHQAGLWPGGVVGLSAPGITGVLP